MLGDPRVRVADVNSAGRLDVAVVGAGRVGPVLGAALRAAGHRITGITALTRQAAERVEALLPDVPWIEPAAAFAADLVLLAVPDDVLGPLVTELAPNVRRGSSSSTRAGCTASGCWNRPRSAGPSPSPSTRP